MDLSDYVREIGVSEFAARFGITERAATSYLYGVRRPRSELARRIVGNSPVTWEGIYGDIDEQAEAT